MELNTKKERKSLLQHLTTIGKGILDFLLTLVFTLPPQ